MKKRNSPGTHKLTSARTRPAASLEDQLANVVEREGVVLQTPVGPRRGKTKIGAWKVAAAPTPAPQSDAVEQLDYAVVGLTVDAAHANKEKSIAIKRGAHERSAYVVSLQKIKLIKESTEPRHQVAAADYGLPKQQAYPIEVYATLKYDLQGLPADPWMAQDQFTPATFDEAFRQRFGAGEWLHARWRGLCETLSPLFQRVEKVEKKIEHEAEDALCTVEVPKFSVARALVGFCALLLLVTLPAKALLLYRTASENGASASQAGTQAVDDLLSAKDAANVPDSADSLKRASSSFRAADSYLGQTNALAVGLASVMPKTFRSARALLEVGDKASEAARLLAVGFDKVFADPERRLDERLDVLAAYARGSLQLMSDASLAASTVDVSSVPAAQRAKITSLLGSITQAQGAVSEFATLADAFSKIAGRDSLRNYLVIFQNNTEIRPTGGFMGSYAEVTLDRGEIKKVSVPSGGTYAIKGQLMARIVPPQPLQLVNSLWQFQDANWFPDFPTSADKIRWFWSKSGQETIDGVITVNASFMQKLLQITGPVDLPSYGKTITADNFMAETQKEVEIDYDKQANTPKKFVGDLAQIMLGRLKTLDKSEWLQVAGAVADSLETKDIQVAFSNSGEEQLAEKYGWSGRLKDTSGDSLAVIEANIAGQKTDGVIDEKVEHRAAVGADGSIEDTVTFTRTHNGRKGDLFNGVRNVAFLRVYVPKGSKLEEASGFKTPEKKFFQTVADDETPDGDIEQVETGAQTTPDGVTLTEENGRTVFGGWLQLDPGQSQTVSLKYRLPFTTSDILAKLDATPATTQASPRGAYLLLLTSQSGKTDRTITTSVSYPESWKIAWSKPAEQNNALGYSGTWDRDRVLAALLSPANGQSTQNTGSTE